MNPRRCKQGQQIDKQGYWIGLGFGSDVHDDGSPHSPRGLSNFTSATYIRSQRTISVLIWGQRERCSERSRRGQPSETRSHGGAESERETGGACRCAAGCACERICDGRRDSTKALSASRSKVVQPSRLSVSRRGQIQDCAGDGAERPCTLFVRCVVKGNGKGAYLQ